MLWHSKEFALLRRSPTRGKKKQPFCHVPVMVLVVFLSFPEIVCFNPVVVQLQLQLSYAQKRFCCGLKGLKAPLFALGQGPPRGARAISCFLFCFTAFQFVAVCCTIDSFDSESTTLLGAMSANQSLICKVQMVHWQ